MAAKTKSALQARSSAPTAIRSGRPFFQRKAESTSASPFFHHAAAGESLQHKLVTGRPGDAHEREADAFAEAAVGSAAPSAAGPALAERVTPLRRAGPQAKADSARGMRSQGGEEDKVQAKEDEEEQPVQAKAKDKGLHAGEEEEKVIQAKAEDERIQTGAAKEKAAPAKDEEEEPVQARADGIHDEPAVVSARKLLQAEQGQGAALLADPGRQLARIFGADFRAVRIHTDGEAVRLAQSLHAQAFTRGNHIYFNTGRYDPSSTQGRRLLAHELTHTLQQGASKPVASEPPALEQPQAPPPQNDAARGAVVAEPSVVDPAGKGPAAPLPSATSIAGARPPARTPGPGLPGPGEPLRASTAEAVAAVPEAGAARVPAAEVAAAATTAAPPAEEGAAPTEGAAAPAEIHHAPASPQEDPAFQKTMQHVRATQRSQRRHAAEPDVKRDEIAEAERLDPKEQKSQNDQQLHLANMNEKAETVKGAKPFTPETFRAKFSESLKEIKLPKDQDDMDRFKGEKTLGQVIEKAVRQVTEAGKQVGGPIADEAKERPESKRPTPEPVDLKQEPAGKTPVPIDPAAAAPKPKDDAEISLERESRSLDELMAGKGLTEEQLAESNEPQFLQALGTKQRAQAEAEAVPARYREKEGALLARGRTQAGLAGRQGLGGMFDTRQGVFGEVFTDQKAKADLGKTKLASVRLALADEYNSTKVYVGEILELLTRQVDVLFTTQALVAKLVFESRVDDDLDWVSSHTDFYASRRGGLRWGTRIDRRRLDEFRKDSLFPTFFVPAMDDEFAIVDQDLAIEIVFREEKQRFLATMDLFLDQLAHMIAEILNMAVSRIEKGKRKSVALGNSLDPDQPDQWKQAQEALKFYTVQYDTLRESVDDKEQELASSLAESYKTNEDSLRESFDKIVKDKFTPWYEKAWDWVSDVASVIAKLADLLASVLSRLADLIPKIVRHPIRFLENLGAGIAGGVETFIGDIGAQLKDAFFDWLRGTDSGARITMPDKFDARGLFSLAAQFADLTYESFRELAVTEYGRKVVEVLETGATVSEKGLELFQIARNEGLGALWDHLEPMIASHVDEIYEKAKQTVLYEAIDKALKFIAGLFMPAGAFIAAVKLLYKAFKFLVDNIDRIRVLVDAFLDSLAMAVAGNVDGIKNKVIGALHGLIVMAIDALAKILGLGDLGQKVRSVIKAISSPIKNAMKWLLNKLKPVVMPVARALEIGVRKGKAAAKQVLAKGKAGVAAVKAKLVQWWRAHTSFEGDDGLTHSLFLDGLENSSRLMVASERKPYTAFLKLVEEEKGLTSSQRKALPAARGVAAQIDEETAKRFPPDLTEKQRERAAQLKEKRIKRLLAKLVKHTKGLFDTSLPESVVKFAGEKQAGFGTGMRAKPLTRRVEEGSSPTKKEHPTYDALNRRRGGEGSYYVRGHLLNQSLGGKGTWENMTPLSQTGNRDHETRFESIVKAAVNMGAIVEYSVKPEYHARTDDRESLKRKIKKEHGASEAAVIEKIIDAEDNVPRGLTCKMYRLEKSGKNRFERTSAYQHWTVLNTVERDAHTYFVGGTPSVFPIDVNHASPELLKQIPHIERNQVKNIYNAVEERDRGFGRYEVMAEEVKNPDLKTLEYWNLQGWIVLGRDGQ